MPDADPGLPHPWAVVAALGATQVISWGTLYYAFAVVMGDVARDLDVSPPTVVGAYGLALLVSGLVAVPVGRHIDRHGARGVMTAGSVAAGLLLAVFSQVTGVWLLYAAWAGLGVAMGLVLYEPAFAALALIFRANLRKAITILTLAGGLASTVFWPLTQWLDSAYGWRVAVLGLAAINLVVCVPLHANFLPRTGRPAGEPRGVADDPAGRSMLLADWRFRALALAFALNMLAFSGITLHLLSMLVAKGFTPERAAFLAALVGPMQVAGRVVEFSFAHRATPKRVGSVALFCFPVAVLALALGGTSDAAIVLFAALFGASNGVMTIVRGTVPVEIWGRDGYGGLTGLMATPVLLARAAGPFFAAWLLATTGDYLPMALVIALVGFAAWGAFEVAVRLNRR